MGLEKVSFDTRSCIIDDWDGIEEHLHALTECVSVFNNDESSYLCVGSVTVHLHAMMR